MLLHQDNKLFIQFHKDNSSAPVWDRGLKNVNSKAAINNKDIQCSKPPMILILMKATVIY